MKTKITFRTNPIFQNCPNCGVSNTLRVSQPRDWKENLADNFTFYKVYRCRQCGWRDYISTFNSAAITPKVILLYAGGAVLVAYIVATVLGKLVK